MAEKAARAAAREAVAAYHEACLAELVSHVGEAVNRFRTGEMNAFDVDRVLFQYSLSAKELWKFCNLADVTTTAEDIHRVPPPSWWERGATKDRRQS